MGFVGFLLQVTPFNFQLMTSASGRPELVLIQSPLWSRRENRPDSGTSQQGSSKMDGINQDVVRKLIPIPGIKAVNTHLPSRKKKGPVGRRGVTQESSSCLDAVSESVVSS